MEIFDLSEFQIVSKTFGRDMDIRDIILIDGDETPSTSSLAMLPTASPRLGVSVTGKALVAQGTPAVDLTKKAAGSAAPQLANATSDKTSSNNNKSILDFFGRVPKGTTPTNGLKKTPTTGAAQVRVNMS